MKNNLSGKSNSDLCYVIRYTELKNEAGVQLLKQPPSNSDLCYVIRYTELKNEASQELRSRFSPATELGEEALIQQIADQVLARPGSLKMSQWHCGTSHCLAGWAAVLDPLAAQIERKETTAIAGCAVLPSYARFFYSDDDTVLAMLREKAGEQRLPVEAGARAL